jgi:N-ethylmaleimide reductase
MAPMTRDRAGPGRCAERSYGRILRPAGKRRNDRDRRRSAEPGGQGLLAHAGHPQPEQVAGWRKVTDAVHARGGRIVMQLMHCGRVVVPANRGFDAEVIAPSAIVCPMSGAGAGRHAAACAEPRAILANEIPRAAGRICAAASQCRSGRDGRRRTALRQRLPDQPVPQPGKQPARPTNMADRRRTAPAFPSKCCGLWPMPSGRAGSASGSRPATLQRYGPGRSGGDLRSLRQRAAPLGLAYCHVVDMGLEDLDTLAMVRASFGGPIIANNNLKADSAAALLRMAAKRKRSASGALHRQSRSCRADRGRMLRSPNPTYSLLYTGEERGYTDYPRMVAGDPT